MKSPVGWKPACCALLAAASFIPRLQAAQADSEIVVASKPFGESYLIAEMVSQLLEHHQATVRRRLGLGTTEILFQAALAGEIDVYPEYTGTALLVLLKEEPSGEARAVYRRVASESINRWGLRWLPPLGFQNIYAIAARREVAEARSLRTLSDLAAAGPELRAGFSPDFVDREDGLQGLRQAYGLEFQETKVLLQAIKYAAISNDEVDVIDAYSTDGALSTHDLIVLQDDRSFFPPYEAALVVSPLIASERPELVAALTLMSGRLDEDQVRSWNARIEIEQQPVEVVAAAALRDLGLVGSESGDPTRERGGVASSFGEYLWSQRYRLLSLTKEHLVLVALSMAAAIGFALPLGLLLYRLGNRADAIIGTIGVLQTLPGIALLAFMVPLLGIGVLPAVVALFFYSLFPILRNTYTGLREADRDAVQAAWTLGMTPLQLLLQVRLPIASPMIMAGIRTATVLNVGTSTLAAFIGGGGLGDPIVRGLALSHTWMILSGAVPAAMLAFAMDGLLAAVERWTALPGLKRQ